MSGLFKALRRRNIFRVAGVLAVVGFAVVGCSLAHAASAQSEQPRVGSYKDTKTLTEIYGEDIANEMAERLPPDFEIEFQIFAPETYDPKNPPGILVYISPSKTGRPSRDWDRMLQEQNLIWVSVNNSGNYKDSIQRIFEAMASLDYARLNYQIDDSRKYLTGFSGGGKTASQLDQEFPSWFDGAIYIAGAFEPEFIRPENHNAAKRKPYFFLVGDNDFAKRSVKHAFRRYQKAGYEKLKLMEIRGLTHRLPSIYDMRDAIDFLDENIARPITATDN